MRRRLGRLLGVTLVVALLLGLVAALWAHRQLRASLPVLNGTVTLPGLGGPVSVERDAIGVPWIRGASRVDVARATGFLHGQERFFQMDLSRRRAAGELAALVGPRAVPIDRDIRIHRFRAEARHAVSLLTPDARRLLDSYTAGVNAGLEALAARPFEYAILRQTPRPWLPEDTFLVILSMFVTLQESDGAFESALATMHDVLPPELVRFLTPAGGVWDAAIDDSTFTAPPLPGPDVYDLRARRRGKPAVELPEDPVVRRSPSSADTLAGSLLAQWDPALRYSGALGSNNWAIAGSLTDDGRPLLANDMHLAIRVPNTWYRAALEWPDAAAPSGRRQLVGVTLPGVPAVVVGSNTEVAWGFTNTYADWSDIVLLELDPSDRTRYRTPHGWKTVERHEEVIKVAGGAGEPIVVEWTVWGPVMPPDHKGRPRAYRWVAHDAASLATSLTPIEKAGTVTEVFDAANGRGTPGQNIVAVDREGRIGWSIFGAIPRRVGLDGQLPVSWADGARGWQGFLDAGEYPRIIDPAGGRIWTANSRVAGGEMLARLGDGSYEVGSRASVIRRRLYERERFSKADLLAIQLDTSADFLARWRGLILETLTDAAVRGHEGRSAAKALLNGEWSGQASADSAAYRLTRAFRDEVTRRVIASLLAECYEADPAFDYRTFRRREEPIWRLVTEKPMHLLDSRYRTWEALLLTSLDEVVTAITSEGSGALRERTWAEFNITAFRHPLSGSLPLVGRWLDMPGRALPGDLFTPRMHWGANGASQRMIVSPGREAEGILHMPTGQSGHPLSPFYSSSHDAWVEGRPTPLLPDKAEYVLTLEP